MKNFLLFLVALTTLAGPTNTVIIIPAALRDLANDTAKASFDAAGGEHTFTVPLVSDGQTNITHYWCAAIMSASNRALLNVWTNAPAFAGQVKVGDYDLAADPTAPFRMLETNGLAVYSPTEAQ